jgi:GNAT superfamily N-acetyltransferase
MLRRVLRQIKGILLWLVEFKGGIMLAMPVRHSSPSRMTSPEHGVEPLTELPEVSPFDTGRLTERVRQGHVLYGMVEHESLVVSGWVSAAGSRIPILHDMTFQVPARCIYIWDCYTLPAERGRGRFQALLYGILDECRAIDTAFVAVDSRNAPSIRALQKVGFQPLFRYYGLKLFNRPVLGLARTPAGFRSAQKAFDHIVRPPEELQSPH